MIPGQDNWEGTAGGLTVYLVSLNFVRGQLITVLGQDIENYAHRFFAQENLHLLLLERKSEDVRETTQMQECA